MHLPRPMAYGLAHGLQLAFRISQHRREPLQGAIDQSRLVLGI